MNPFNRLRFRVAQAIGPKVKNSNDAGIGQDFWRYGNRNVMAGDWSQVVISDRDIYKGWMYAAITKRARRCAQIAIESIKTRGNETAKKLAEKTGVDLEHPYLAALRNSPTFTDGQLWIAFSTYTDLEGAYYLLAVRTIADAKVGNVQEFKLLSPYNITRVKDKDSLEVQGYTEVRGSFRRDIPKQMIIPTRVLNPFSEDETFSMTDAAKDPAFTMQQADDYTRSSLRHNIKSSGIVSTDVVLDKQKLANFRASMMDGNKGEPAFTDATGNIKYDPMQIDLDKSALKDINQINVEKTLVVTGTSKTTLGVETSGVTRDTSETQSELFVTGEILPQIQIMIDALNQDYRNMYPDDYKKYGYEIYLDSPLGADREAELKDIDIRNKSYNIYAVLRGQGYSPETAADFALGKIELSALGDPTDDKLKMDLSPDTVTFRESDTPPAALGAVDQPDDPEDTPATPKNGLVKNAADQSQIQSQAASLQSAIMQIEARVAAAVSKKVTNSYDDQSDIISDQDRKQNEQELLTALALFYTVIVPLQAASVLSQRAKEYSLFTSFKMTPEVQRIIKENATKAAGSHMDTILQDLLEAVQVAVISGGDVSDVVAAVQRAYKDEPAAVITDKLRAAAVTATRAGGEEATAIKDTAQLLHDQYKDSNFDDLLASVRESALKGASQHELQSAIRKEYSDISKTRAQLIATSETNRAFVTSQYEADKQFLAQAGLEGQAYKQLEIRSDNPCPFCLDIAAQGAIPFGQPFASVGDVLSATVTKADGTTSVRKMPVTYESIEAGNVHPRCNCDYILTIR